MTIKDILLKGIEFANIDVTSNEMLADFSDHKIGLKLDTDDVTLVVNEGVISLEDGIRDDCHAVMGMKNVVMCDAIDNTIDLMEIREKAEMLKGDPTDPNMAVHFMSTFPFFDAMVRLYEDDPEFQKQVAEIKASF